MTSAAFRVKSLPTMQELCISAPLYEEFPFTEGDSKELAALRYFSGHIDAFCLTCGQDAIFRSFSGSSYVPNDATKDAVFSMTFGCARNATHELVFMFRINDRVLHKIGQHPSIADLSQPQLRRYRTVLDKATHFELVRAVGLAAHGVGIGAFIYLRRIFERLIESARTRASATQGWDADLYAKGRMDEKILLLREELPDFLVANRSLYGILSKGVHELSEEECLAAFPVAKLGIELILDADLAMAERKRKLREAEKAIGQLRQSTK